MAKIFATPIKCPFCNCPSFEQPDPNETPLYVAQGSTEFHATVKMFSCLNKHEIYIRKEDIK